MRCEHRYATKTWPYVTRCTAEATHNGTDPETGERVSVCEGHTHFVEDPEPI